MLNEKNFKEFIELIESLTDSKLEVTVSFRNLYLKNDLVDIMIRDNQLIKIKQLVLARIFLDESLCHQGIGTKVIDWLSNYAKENHYNRVLIESVQSIEMANLAKKLDFTLVESVFKDPEFDFVGTYIKTI